MSPHWCKLQISIVIGHMVKHVSHGNHHRWVGGLLLLLLLIVFIIFLFLWLLETTGQRKNREGRVGVKEITGLNLLRRTTRKRRSRYFMHRSVFHLLLTDL